MFKNYLKVSFRNILRPKGYSFINIAGFSIGMASCLLLFLWVQDELSYDRYHEKSNQIYRVVYHSEVAGHVRRSARTPAPLGPALVYEFPEIEKAVRFGRNRFLVRYQNRLFYEDIFFADPEVFDVFTFQLVKGNPKTALKDPYSIIVSEEIIDKYFRDDDPIGKTITLDERSVYKITGVFKNIPQNSHFRFSFLGSFLDYAPSHFDQWGISNYYTYVLISKDYLLNEFREKLPQFVEKYRGRELKNLYKITYPLQPLIRIHLHSDLIAEIEPNSKIGNLYIFSIIALFILVIASANYINLTTAKYADRTKEVGLRKIFGATRRQLVKQFLGESFLFSLFALPFAVFLAKSLLPLFNSLSRKDLIINYSNNLFLLLGLVIIIFGVGILSGIFPAFYISALQPVNALRGMFKARSKISWFRRTLVVFQFGISIIFIISAFVMSNQLNYMRDRNLGLNKEHIVNIPIYSKGVLRNYETVKSEFLQNAHVLAVSASSFFPGENIWYQSYWREGVSDDENLEINWIPVDHDFLKTFQIKLIEGRDFSKKFQSDLEYAYILNESAAKKFGWKSPIGKEFRIIKKGTVIGVVEDFHFESLHQEIKPVALYIYPEMFAYLSVRISSSGVSHALHFLRNKWEELIPEQTFEYSFLDEDFNNLYKADMRLSKIFGYVSLFAIFIACLGLLGLAAFTVKQRTKEIATRKILGASIQEIIILLSKEFSKWVLVSNIIAWPIAYFIMNNWLQNYAYRINIGIWTFFLSGILALVIVLLTVSFQAIRSALANPVEALRYE